jgi:short chain dehydrogenase
VTITSYWAGSVAVVTGAGAGIGRALAMEAARRGAKVVVSDVEVDAAVGVADEITRSGGEALPVFCDVTDAASIDALAATTVSSFGQVESGLRQRGRRRGRNDRGRGGGRRPMGPRGESHRHLRHAARLRSLATRGKPAVAACSRLDDWV